MTRKETTAIALKCFAVYLIAQVIISLPVLVGICLKLGYFGQHDTPVSIIISISLLSVMLGLAAALLLWKLTNNLLTTEIISESAQSELGAEEIIKIILACMGVYFAIGAVVAFPRVFVDFQIAKNSTDHQPLVSGVNLLSVVLQIIFGCILIAKPARWARVLKKLRKE